MRPLQSAVEGALIVAAIALMASLTMWRAMRLRRKNRPLRDFFRVSSPERSSSIPTRPPTVPRTTGLPPTSAPPASVIYDTLSPPLPLAYRGDGQRRGRGRRTYAGDIDAAGRRGPVTHPEDPNEVLPEYDDKDVLPRYQDLETGTGAGSGRGIGGMMPGEVGGDAGRMAGVGTMFGRSPNGDGGMSDTDLLVTRLRASAASQDEHVYPPPIG
ncbi:hypothetical protein BV20DRAFT_966028 [Pilatotrama ljubarskyi]|nr:hypothetical protein BV20DRAFT_966028 [Pilatotrama ljubarskyi]